MKDEHLTLRLSRALARALARRARERGIPKSQLARDAVSQYLAPSGQAPSPGRGVTAADLLARWASVPRLGPAEAAEFASDLAAARGALPGPGSPWG